jgi:hypothetical protein
MCNKNTVMSEDEEKRNRRTENNTELQILSPPTNSAFVGAHKVCNYF